MNRVVKNMLNAAWYMIMFLLIQTAVQFAGCAIWAHYNGHAFDAVLKGFVNGSYSELLAITTAVSGIVTIAVFGYLKWTPMSPQYLRTRPWAVFFWAFLLAIGTILPTEWIYEQLQIAMPEQTTKLFEGVMREPWGYVAVGLVAPFAEEVVFRGGVLRVLLDLFDRRMHWVAIVVSALIFGAIHANLAQGIHGFVIGLLLGWMYYRTGSILPGIILHWVNNTVAYVMFNLMPQLNDGKLIDLFHGSDRMMYMALAFSGCILLPSLYQLALRMKRKEK